jgi:large subunit ribosomal protein L32
MPTPKRKLSRSRRDSRSANKGITAKPFSVCKTEYCETALLGHSVCSGCGIYDGVQVVQPSKVFLARREALKKTV